MTNGKGQISENLGNPQIFNFEKKEYNGGNQTWKIHIDSKGFTWFANNVGIIRTDGSTWTLINSPNSTIVRSIEIDSNNTVYAGLQGDFGYFKLNKQSKYVYTSLALRLKEKNIAFTDVWNVFLDKNGVFFRTDSHLFRYHKDQLTEIKTNVESLNLIANWNNELVIQDNNNFLYQFKDGQFVKKAKNNIFDKGRISSVINYSKDTVLITTIDNGIFYESEKGYLPWKTSNDSFLKKNIIFCSEKLPNGKIALGTSFSGLVVIDSRHRLELILDKKKGLQNNSVLSMKSNKSGQVWLGLDKGIDLADLNSPYNIFYPDQEIQGSTYGVFTTNRKFYFGTNTGLYAADRKEFYNPSHQNQFSKVLKSNGQVWSINDVDGNLIMGHHNGAYLIDGTTATKLPGPSGVWRFLKIKNGQYIAGSYSGLYLYDVSGKKISLNRKIEGFFESSRILQKDSLDNIWIAHPYRGIYCLKQSSDYREVIEFTKNHPLLVKMVYNISNKIIVEDKNKFYTINPSTFKLEVYKNLDSYIKLKEGLEFLFEDEYKNIWYSTKKETAVLLYGKSKIGEYHKYELPFLKGKLVPGFQVVHCVTKEMFFIGTDKGVLSFNTKKILLDNSPPKLFLSEASVANTQGAVMYSANSVNVFEKAKIKIKYNDSDIKFKFAIHSQNLSDENLYSHKLEGSDLDWSEWSNDQVIRYNKLNPGGYSLLVKVKNPEGTISEPLEIKISVSPPWYRSIFAYFIYASLLLLSLYYFYLNIKKKHKLERIRLLERNKELKAEAEKDSKIAYAEIIRLQNEKLKSEIQFKNKELTSSTYHLVEKNELINAIKSLISNLEKKFSDNPEINKELKQIHKLTQQNAHEDEEWSTFIASFDEVHADFFKRLNMEFKDLSPTDYRMCTYLRMNLTSKEIASLMNISIRSVETNRYRLRKKLNLSSETNLTQFILMY